jgi:hypothetical protein
MISYSTVEDPKGKDEGTPIKFTAFSEKKMQEKQKLAKLIADLDIAILKAMGENDYSKLQQLTGGNPKPETTVE